MQKRKDLYSNDDTFKDRNTVKLKDWKPVTLILVIEDYAQKLPAAIAQYHITIFWESMFLSEDIGLMVHFLSEGEV